jgi:hypothetical protein
LRIESHERVAFLKEEEKHLVVGGHVIDAASLQLVRGKESRRAICLPSRYVHVICLDRMAKFWRMLCSWNVQNGVAVIPRANRYENVPGITTKKTDVAFQTHS